MKTFRLMLSTLLLLFCCTATHADTFVNLTPTPKTMTVGNGTLTLPAAFKIATTGNFSDEMTAEVTKFVTSLNAVTGLGATVSDVADDALVRVSNNASLAPEAYTFSVDASGVSLAASTPQGLFYAFQTFKKLLPPHVMANVQDANVTTYALPYVSIEDKPRYEQRSFMLDVSRHFFTVEQVKRMLDLMACYKMNYFHWHLTDDQGWRVEIKKWPKLTEVGSIAPNCRRADIRYGQYYWTNEPYGPYFYTQDELREVVAYAKERHIEIIPEIDMPGHFVAALVAYPEFSCTPDAARSVWVNGGISSDVLNVANPAAVNFAKDILAELIDIFPGEYIHIGGDECPTTAWQNNAECQQMYQELGLTNYRQMQSHFMKEVGTFIKEKGRKVAVWNEAITESGADTELMKEIDACIYCWTGGSEKATQLGLKSVYTPYGPYYINRKQRPDDLNAGDGSNTVQQTYNQSPYDAAHGVQATFWTEHVSEPEHLEYQALPKLIAVAEAGWTPQANRNFTDFCKRITADSTMLNYNNYTYNRDYMTASSSDEKVMPVASTAEKPFYYRIVTRATGDRSGRCWELLREGSPLITEYSGKNAGVGKLWTNAQAEESDAAYDWQLWAFELDPNGSGRYAIVCKAQPDGSLNPTPSATSTSGRWSYDNSTKHYDFILGEGSYYGGSNGTYYYSIRSNNVQGQYLNSSLGGQGFAVNVYGNPADGNGGLFTFNAMSESEGGNPEPPVVVAPLLEVDKIYSFINTVEGFEGVRLCDNGTSDYLTHSTSIWSNDAWRVTQNSEENGVQTIRLKNVSTNRGIGSSATSSTGTLGFPVKISGLGSTITLTYNPAEDDFTFSSDGKNFYPVSAKSSTLPGIISSGSNAGDQASNAFRPMGTAWKCFEVTPYTYVCKDTDGNDLGSFTRSVQSKESNPETICPEIQNHIVVTTEVVGTTVNVTYERAAYAIVIEARDQKGALLSREELTVPKGEAHTVALPQHTYYNMTTADVADGETITPEADRIITATYATEAYTGVKALGEPVSEIVAGRSYLIYDNSDANNGGRRGFRTVKADTKKVNRVGRAEGATPYTPWTFEASGSGYKIKNEYLNAYVPAFGKNVNPAVEAAGDVFTLSKNADESWKIKGTSGQCWDGQENGNMVGWDDPGHPHIIYEYFAEPYFEVLVQCKNAAGESLATETRSLVKGGAAFTLTAPSFEGLVVQSIEGEDALSAVGSHTIVTIVYADPTGIGSVEADGAEKTGIFDLSGRRLNGIGESGVYIVNGKKVFVK